MIKLGKLVVGTKKDLLGQWCEGYDTGSDNTRQHVESLIVSQIKFLKRNVTPNTLLDTNSRINELKYILMKVKVK